MTKNILSTPVKQVIKLGDEEYKLSPLNLNVLAGIEEDFNCGIAELGELLEKRQASTLRKLIHILLRDQCPDMTVIKVGELIDIKNLAEVSEALAKVLTGE